MYPTAHVDGCSCVLRQVAYFDEFHIFLYPVNTTRDWIVNRCLNERNLDLLWESVNLRLCLCAALALSACGPSPRPVPPLPPADSTSAQLPSAPRVVWHEDVGSGATSGLEIRGPALFATTTNRAVVALTTDNGRRYWLQRFDGAITTGTAIAGNRLFVATQHLNGSAHALNATRGRKLWSRRIGPTRWKALLIDDRVHFATDQGWLYALSARDGAIVWSTRVAGTIVTAPQSLNNEIVIATSHDSIYRIARSDGAVLQRAGIPATASAPSGLAGDTLLVPLHDGSAIGLHAATLVELFRVRLEVQYRIAQPVRVGDAFFLLSRNAVLWRVHSGEAARVAELNGAARASLATVQDHLIVGLLDGRVIALEPSGKRRWEVQLPRSIVAPVLGSRSALYVPLINGEVWKLE